MIKAKFYLFLFIFAAAPLLNAQKAQDPNLSALLGGMVQSDSWIIRKDKAEEEFIGNVHYENDLYKIHADKALSRRAEQIYILEGNVSAACKDKDFSARITAAKVFYDNIKKSGFAAAPKNAQVTLFYEPAGGKTYRLYGDRLDFAEQFTAYKLTGDAELDDFDNTLYAQQMSYNLNTGIFEAQGRRPLLFGFSDDGDYALQADTITALTRQGVYKAQGRAQGWVVMAKDRKDWTKGMK